jgi:hypothetical protein
MKRLPEANPADRAGQSTERWYALPEVIRATFECTRKVSMYQSLRALGVPAVPSRAVEWAYESTRGPLVVTVWHDHIEQEADGSLAYRIAPLEWQAESRTGPQAERAARMRALLAQHAGQDVYVLLLKRGWDSQGTQKAERNAPDIRMWTLEPEESAGFVLRRPVARSAA